MGFDRVPLGELVTLKRGYDLPAPARRAGPVPVVSSRGVTGRHDVARVRAPGVVTGRTGTLGSVFFLDEDFWPLNTTLYVRDFKGNDPRFVAYLLETVDFHAYNDKAAIPGVSPAHLHGTEVVRPPLRTQRAVARTLARLDRRRDLLRRLDGQAAALGRALFLRLPRGRPRRVEELCTEIGNGATPRRRVPAYWGGGVPWFRSGELDDGPLVRSRETITERGLAESACRLWPEGALLLAMYAAPTVGRLGLLAAPAAANQACCALVAHEPHFLLHALLASRAGLARLATGAAQQNISQEVVRAHEVEVPGAGAVRAFEARAARLAAARAAGRRERLALRAFRAALLPALVEGHRDFAGVDAVGTP